MLIKERIKQLEDEHKAIIQQARDGDVGAKAKVQKIGAKVEHLIKLQKDYASSDDILNLLGLFGDVEEQVRKYIAKIDAKKKAAADAKKKTKKK